MTNKFLINCQYGGDDLEKATVAMIVASAASAMGGETAVFMTGESVRMAAKGGVETSRLPVHRSSGSLAVMARRLARADEERILAAGQTRGERIGTDSGLWEKIKPKWPMI